MSTYAKPFPCLFVCHLFSVRPWNVPPARPSIVRLRRAAMPFPLCYRLQPHEAQVMPRCSKAFPSRAAHPLESFPPVRRACQPSDRLPKCALRAKPRCLSRATSARFVSRSFAQMPLSYSARGLARGQRRSLRSCLPPRRSKPPAPTLSVPLPSRSGRARKRRLCGIALAPWHLPLRGSLLRARRRSVTASRDAPLSRSRAASL